MTSADSPRRIVRRLAIGQLVTAVGDGAVLATSAIYFTSAVHLASIEVGVGLAIGAFTGLVTSVPLGAFADRIGLNRAIILFCGIAMLGLLLFATAHTAVTYAIASATYTMGTSNIGATRQALVAASLASEERVKARGLLHATLNLGLGLGSIVGALALLIGRDEMFTTIFIADAALFAAAALIYLSLPAPAIAPTLGRTSAWPVLRDGRYVGLTLLVAVTECRMSIINVILPLWIVSLAGAPPWLSAAVLLVNTVIVVAIQVPVSARVHDSRTARLALIAAGVCLVIACTAFGVLGLFPPGAMVAVALVGAVALTVGEVISSSGAWHYGFSLAPDTDHGQYQAMFTSSMTLARMMGTLLMLPLVAATGLTGWLILGGVILLASLAIPLLDREGRGRAAVGAAGRGSGATAFVTAPDPTVGEVG